MLKVKLAPEVVRRLGAFLRSRGDAVRSDHWKHYGSLSHIRIEGDYVLAHGGAGFDSEYELNFRRRSMRESLGSVWHAIRGRNDLQRHRHAYRTLWQEMPPTSVSPHQILAAHYMRLIGNQSVRNYLEIGAGTGYLAALAHEAWNANVTIIDLPEILPFGFLYLHSRFPDATFALPNEPGPATFTFLTDGTLVPQDSIDLAVNTASFGEMRKEVIDDYFALIRRALKPGGKLFTVNREEKIMDGRPIRFRDYPWVPNDVDDISGESAFHAITQPSNRMLVRLSRMAKNGPDRLAG